MNYLAIDVGAPSGRHIVGSTDTGTLVTEEVFRFDGYISHTGGRWYCDAEKLVSLIKEGTDACLARYGKIDEALGLIETAEKAADIYMKTAHLPRLNGITTEQFHALEERFGVKARNGWLD